MIHLRDGGRAEGVVESVGWRIGPEYENAYRSFQEKNPRGPLLPDLGIARLILEGALRQQTVTFLGLDERGVVVRHGSADPKRIPFLALGFIAANGRTAEGSLLVNLAREGHAPLLTEIRLAQPARRVALDAIASIERPVMKGQGLQGAAFGLILDAMAAVIVHTALLNADFGISWP